MAKPLFETDFNFKPFEYNRKIMNGKFEVIQEKVVIAVKFERKKDKLYILDPIVNSFIHEYLWLNETPPNSQKQVVKPICIFLNFCRLMVAENEPDFLDLKNGFYALKLLHASRYLEHQASRVMEGKIKSSTLHEQVRPIIWFYHFLIESGFIEEKVETLMTFNKKKKWWEVAFNPFRSITELRVEIPKKEVHLQHVRDFTYDDPAKRIKNIRLMIDLARYNYKDIAFLLCVMFYGGLRLAEAVNLTKKSMERPKYYDDNDYGDGGFTFDVKDNEELFQHLKTKSNNQVKSKRAYLSLEMYDNDLISKVYKEHKVHLKELEEKRKIKNKNALFCSSHIGNPLTYNAAYRQFKQLAELFVNVLIANGDRETLNELTDNDTENIKIHPHLCRAVFTNMGIDLGYTKAQLKQRRRDGSEEAQAAYRNKSKKVKETRQIIVNKTQEDALEALKRRNGEFKE